MISREKLSWIAADVRAKPAFSQLEEPVVLKEIDRELALSPKLVKLIERHAEHAKLRRAKLYKTLIRAVRARLHRFFGAFEIDHAKREAMIAALEGLKDLEGHRKILSTHRSTRERLQLYQELYPKLFALTGKPRSLLDLGCGLNPFSLPWMGFSEQELKELRYYASDLSVVLCRQIEAYFAKLGVHGKAIPLDLREIEEVNVLTIFPHTDLCFLFKVLDLLEQRGHKLAERLIKAIDADFVIASFSTRTLSGAPMAHPYRGWVERMSARLGWSVQLLALPGELFYIINKRGHSELERFFKEGGTLRMRTS